MKRILYVLAFIFFGLFGVVNEGWSEPDTIYKNEGSIGTIDGITATGNINNTASNGNPAPAFGNTTDKNTTFTFTGFDVSDYENLELSIDAKFGSFPSTTDTWPYATVTFYKNNVVVKTDNTTIKWTTKGNTYSTYTISNIPDFDKIIIVCSPASGTSGKGNPTTSYSTYMDNITLTGEGEAPKYTITFNNCGIQTEQTQENHGDEIIFNDGQCSNDCKLNGWKFLGWFTSNENHNTKVSSPYIPTSNITLYAWYSLGENNVITDTLDYYLLGVPSDANPQYQLFTNKKQSSNAIYCGKSGGSHEAIQLRIDNFSDDYRSGIISSNTGGLLHSIKVKWNSNTANNRSLQIYTSDTAYKKPNDMWNDGIQLNYLSIDKDDNNEKNLSNKPFIGIRAAGGPLYLDTIFITWKNGNDIQYSINPKCFSTPITITEWFENSVEFDINGKDSLYNEPFTECDSIRMLVTNAINDTCIRWFHVPQFVDGNMSVDPNCDVVVLNGKTFTPQDGAHSKGVYVYPGGTLIVNDEYTVDSLVLRRDNDNIPYFSYNGTLNTNKLYFELRTNGEDWRWLTLPDTLKSSIINGKDEAIIKYYDDSIRAINGRGGWIDEYKTNNKVYTRKYAPGQGCIFGVDSDRKMIYQFELNTNILSKEDDIKDVPVHTYKNPIAPPNDLGWNVIGNPFMDECYISSDNPIRVGQLIHNDSDPWNGGWTISDTIEQKLKYIVEYQNGEYVAIPLTKNGIKLKPYTSFFVQIDTTGSENKVLRFTKDTENYGRAPQRTKQISEETFLQLNINNKQTGCFISNKYNNEYEINADLESFDNQLYQTINDYKLIYSAINDSIIEHGINIFGYGEVSLNDITDINSFEEINIFYNEHWYNLLNGDTPNVQGNFILFARRSKNDIHTGLNETIINTGVKKFIHNGYIYVVRDNEIYSILGEKIR